MHLREGAADGGEFKGLKWFSSGAKVCGYRCRAPSGLHFGRPATRDAPFNIPRPRVFRPRARARARSPPPAADSSLSAPDTTPFMGEPSLSLGVLSRVRVDARAMHHPEEPCHVAAPKLIRSIRKLFFSSPLRNAARFVPRIFVTNISIKNNSIVFHYS